MKAKWFKQGKLLPPTFIGTGMIFLGASIYVLATQKPLVLTVIACCLVYISFWTIFAIKRMQIDGTTVQWRSGFFPVYFRKSVSLNDYSTAVVKTVNVGYTASSSAIYKTQTATTYTEKTTGIFLKEKGKYEFTLLFSGTLEEIDDFIVEHLWLEHLDFYEGIPRADLKIDKKEILKRYSSKTTLEE